MRQQAAESKKGIFSGKDELDPVQLSRECVRLVYRLLFLFYVESRPDLGYVPIQKSDIYARGYSLEMLRDLERVPLNTRQARDGSFFDDTLQTLFRMIRQGTGAATQQQLTASTRDPRPISEFCAHGLFDFRTSSYKQSWSGLRDLNTLAKQSGLRGLVLLFDEFEDILTNMRNIVWQESALWNMYLFHKGREVPVVSFFAVTPEFVVKAKQTLWNKGRDDYNYKWFEELSHFQMSPLRPEELVQLAGRILEGHSAAYSWTPDLTTCLPALATAVTQATRVQVQDRARHAIRSIVETLDGLVDA